MSSPPSQRETKHECLGTKKIKNKKLNTAKVPNAKGRHIQVQSLAIEEVHVSATQLSDHTDRSLNLFFFFCCKPIVCSCQLFYQVLCIVSQLLWSHTDRRLTGELPRMYSPTPIKYMTCAIPNRGAMTRARQPAPLRKAEGPSFRIILLLRKGRVCLNANMTPERT